MQSFDKLILPNGLTLVGERLPHLRSVSVGVWVRTGSADEDELSRGYSHAVEHMVFKGTANRTAQQIAEESDMLGGQTNAFTSKECTCFYTKVMDTHLSRALDLLADLVTRATFPTEEWEREKSVILEEIAMGEDMPDDLAQENLSKAVFGSHALGLSILGTKQSILSATSASLSAFMRARYQPTNAVLSIAGNYDWSAFTALAQATFGHWQGGFTYTPYPALSCQSERLYLKKATEQTHICIAYPALPLPDENNFSLSILNNLLGGSSSSRLFQAIREKEGLAYAVCSYQSVYMGAGALVLYAGTNPQTAQRVTDLMGQQIHLLLKDGVSQQEFDQSREQLKATYVLGMESSGARMNALGRGQLLRGRVRSEEEYLQKLDACTLNNAMTLTRDIFSKPFAASVVGASNVDLHTLEG